MKRKAVSTWLFMLTIVSNLTLIAHAENITITQDTDLTENPAEVTVTAEVSSDYSVIIPKEMVLTQNEAGDYECGYTVDIKGVIADNQYLSVVPQSEIVISTDGKDDVPLTVEQQVIYFRSSDYTGDLSQSTDTVKIDDTSIESNGNISVKDGYKLTTGSWSGTLLFDISLNEDDGN